MRLFGERGYEATSVAEIERSAGLTPGAGGLFHHFRNKEAVLVAGIESQLARLEAVRQAMNGLKESKQAVGAEVLTSVQNLAPPTILAQASRMNFSTRLFNLLVTNVPGPQFPLYALGRELQDLFPVAFLPGNHALAVAIISYNGGIDFGLLGDYDAMPDLAGFAGYLDDARQELVNLAQTTASNGQRASSPRRTSRPRTSSPASTGA